MRTVAVDELREAAGVLPCGATNVGRRYHDAGGRLCAVGAMLNALDLAVPQHHEDANDASVASPMFRSWTASRGYVLDRDAEAFAHLIQQLADRGEMWGEAVAIAERVFAAGRAPRRSSAVGAHGDDAGAAAAGEGRDVGAGAGVGVGAVRPVAGDRQPAGAGDVADAGETPPADGGLPADETLPAGAVRGAGAVCGVAA